MGLTIAEMHAMFEYAAKADATGGDPERLRALLRDAEESGVRGARKVVECKIHEFRARAARVWCAGHPLPGFGGKAKTREV